MRDKIVVFWDAGGVLTWDSHIGAYNQEELENLTGLTAEALNLFQDHTALNLGVKTLTETLHHIAQNAIRTPKPTTEALLAAYKKGFSFYPGAAEMIRELYSAGYQVCILTNNSYEGIANLREMLHREELYCVTVYGSAEMGLAKPHSTIFLKACEAENVKPADCWFIDDRIENINTAKSLGMAGVLVQRPETLKDTTKTIRDCRNALLTSGVLKENKIELPKTLNRGMYPSLSGLSSDPGLFGKKVVRFDPVSLELNVVDQPNADGNQQKRCLYESRLAKLIIESGSDYWKPAYDKINALFLADFDLKNDPAYFSQIERVLKKEGVLENKEKNHAVKELRDALSTLHLREPFDLTTISQFYYGVWLFENYGPQYLEPFVFLTPKNSAAPSNEQILILKLFPDMAHNPESRANAYSKLQSWLTCGEPQLRGRQKRTNGQSAISETFGIIADDDPNAESMKAEAHYAAKNAFMPNRAHPIAQTLQAMGEPIIGGSSGTLGRNIYMLAPLVSQGLLTQQELMQYFMGFCADLVIRGHHSLGEILIVADKILFPLKPWLDSIRDPIGFYEQALTPEFCALEQYRDFKKLNEHFFDTPVNSSDLTR